MGLCEAGGEAWVNRKKDDRAREKEGGEGLEKTRRARADEGGGRITGYKIADGDGACTEEEGTVYLATNGCRCHYAGKTLKTFRLVCHCKSMHTRYIEGHYVEGNSCIK